MNILRSVRCRYFNCKPLRHIPREGANAGFCLGIHDGRYRLCIDTNEVVSVTFRRLPKLYGANRPLFCPDARCIPLYSEQNVCIGMMDTVIERRKEYYSLCTPQSRAFLNHADISAIYRYLFSNTKKDCVMVVAEGERAKSLRKHGRVVTTSCIDGTICVERARREQLYAFIWSMGCVAVDANAQQALVLPPPRLEA